jgi:hypothetical protein
VYYILYLYSSICVYLLYIPLNLCTTLDDTLVSEHLVHNNKYKKQFLMQFYVMVLLRLVSIFKM